MVFIWIPTKLSLYSNISLTTLKGYILFPLFDSCAYSSKFFIGQQKFQNNQDILIKNNNEIFLEKNKYGIIKGFDLIVDKKIFSQSLFSISNIKKSVRYMIDEMASKNKKVMSKLL